MDSSDAQRRAAFASGYKAKGKKGKKKNELKVFGEKVTKLIEKNVPTNPSKWAYYKAQQKEVRCLSFRLRADGS